MKEGSDDYLFIFARHEDIKEGKTTDIYFYRTLKILEEEKLADTMVYAEITISSLPRGYPWGIFGGLRDVAKLFEGIPVDIDAFPEGSVIYKSDYYGIREPVMTIRGPYGKFVIYETPLLGFLCVGSGIASKAARIRKAAGNDVLIVSFGARRTHPAISPFNAFYAYIGGCDAVSCVLGAERFLGMKPVGTMPHSLMIIYSVLEGDHAEAWKAFDRIMPSDVPRIILCDTYLDEVAEAIRAVEKVGPDRIWGFRLDTPSSRRGKFNDIVREVIWELRARGYDGKVFVSGGIDEDAIPELVRAGVSGFGVGSSIANARIVDFAMDIVAVHHESRWVPCAKRGKLSGVKKVYRCPSCLIDVVRLENESAPRCPKCGREMESMLKPLIRNGEVVVEFPKPNETRKYVLEQLEKLELDKKPWD